jgi:hypothetical protein
MVKVFKPKLPPVPLPTWWFCVNVDITDHAEVADARDFEIYQQVLCWKSGLIVLRGD